MSRDTEARKKYLEEYLKRPEVIARRKEITEKYKKSHKGLKNRRRGALFSKYKITEQRYFEILEKQIGLCAICRSDSPGRKGSKNFTVDHDHTTMVVRGLLCHPCNVMLGLAKDNIEVLEMAIKYLKHYKETVYIVK